MLEHAGGDVSTLPYRRALDEPPPGDWTLAFVREGERITGVRVGCWLVNIRGNSYRMREHTELYRALQSDVEHSAECRLFVTELDSGEVEQNFLERAQDCRAYLTSIPQM